jgi:hypothetical protein
VFITLSAGNYQKFDSLLILKDTFAKTNMVYKYSNYEISPITCFPFLRGASLRVASDPGDFIISSMDTCCSAPVRITNSKNIHLKKAYYTKANGELLPNWFKFFFHDGQYEFYFDTLLISSGYFRCTEEKVLLFDENANEMILEVRDDGSTLTLKKFYSITPFCELFSK